MNSKENLKIDQKNNGLSVKSYLDNKKNNLNVKFKVYYVILEQIWFELNE